MYVKALILESVLDIILDKLTVMAYINMYYYYIGAGLERYICIIYSHVYIHVCPFPFLQEACVNLWPATENEIVNEFEIGCNEFKPCRGYDVIKLKVANLTSVSRVVTV